MKTPTVVVQLDNIPLELLTELIRRTGVVEMWRANGTYHARTVPMTPVELSALARELIMSTEPTPPVSADAETAVLERFRADPEPVVRSYDLGELYAFCPIHPEWEPLRRPGGSIHALTCSHPPCVYWTQDPPGARYANT